MRLRATVLRRNRRRGVAMIEFVFVGIAAAALMISTVQLSLAMWNYHTLAYAVHETNRYIASHGRDCALGGNSCTITVANIVSKLETYAIGLDWSSMNMTLTPNSGSSNAVSCNPITTCATSSTQWPPSANLDNDATQPPNSPTYTTIKVSYTHGAGIVGLWFRTKGTRIGSVTLTSQSQIPMLF